MLVEAQITINGSRTAVWAVITDIENARNVLSGVEKIEIVEKPANGLIGLTWKETRMYFGKDATVEKKIIESVENEHFKTMAEDSGFVFFATMNISGSDGNITLTSSHDTQAQGLIAKLKSAPMFLFKSVIKKALMQDLIDIKSAVENG